MKKNWKIAFFEVQISNISQELQEANWREFIQQIDRVLTVPSTIYLQIQMCTLKCQFFCLLFFLLYPNFFEVICQYTVVSHDSAKSCELMPVTAQFFFCPFFMIKLRTVCKNKIGSLFFCQGKGDIIHENAIQYFGNESQSWLAYLLYKSYPNFPAFTPRNRGTLKAITTFVK